MAPDSVVDGRYRLLETLARGGTASVWRAMDERLKREVAVKILRDEDVDPVLRERAEREAHVLASLDHPNLVRVFDSGIEDGTPFIVMELLEGETLTQILSTGGTLPVDEAVALVADVADGLGAAHSRGVIHRDVKPDNILCHDQVPTIVDFGIARSIDATTLTRGLVMGTASYLAPEQAQGRPLTPAVDVYALGCVLYELLTGRPPFQADTSVNVALKHVQETPVPPADLADVPPAVNELVVRCLAKDPAQRPADGTELAVALRASLLAAPSEETVTIAPVAVDGTMVMPALDLSPEPIVEPLDPSPLPSVAPPPAARRAVPWGLVLGAAAAVVLLLLLVSALGNDPSPMRPVPDVLNTQVADAARYLEGAGLEVDVANVPSDTPAGTVIATDPAAGDPIAADGTVELSVSAGPPPTTATTAAPPPESSGEGGDGGGRGKGRDKDD